MANAVNVWGSLHWGPVVEVCHDWNQKRPAPARFSEPPFKMSDEAKRFWSLPSVQHGQAQLPYFYSEDALRSIQPKDGQ
jgi:hypothetical protein